MLLKCTLFYLLYTQLFISSLEVDDKIKLLFILILNQTLTTELILYQKKNSFNICSNDLEERKIEKEVFLKSI